MWLQFDQKRDGGLLICRDKRFFVFQSEDGRRFISPAGCSHKGGPLYMGKMGTDNKCIRCPWHKMHTPTKTLAHRCIPATRVGEKWITKLPSHLEPDDIVVMPLPNVVAEDFNV